MTLTSGSDTPCTNPNQLRFPRGAESEWSIPFLQGMVDRMAVSLHKYGRVADSKGKVDEVRGLLLRLVMYLGPKRAREVFGQMGEIIEAAQRKEVKPGNTEWLMDVANFAMIEFMQPSLPRAYFRATDARESPGLVSTPDEWDGTVEISQRAHDGTPQHG